MCKFIRKSNQRILCKLSESEILRLYSIVRVAMETTKTSPLTCQSKSLVYFSLVTFQLVSCNFSLAMVWQITYTHKLPKLCSATLKKSRNTSYVYNLYFILFFHIPGPFPLKRGSSLNEMWQPTKTKCCGSE